MTAGQLKSCVTDTPEKIQAVLANAQGYYVNLHTEAHPAGAVRGQLMAAITNPQAAVPESASESGAPALARTGPASAGLLVAIGFGLLSAGTVLKFGNRRR